MEQNLRDKFKEALLAYSNQIAIQYKKDNQWRDISYSLLGKNIESLASFLLLKENIKKDDKIALILNNRPEWPLIFLSTVFIGAISTPINPEANQKEIENILKDSESKIVFISDELSPSKKQILKQCQGVKKVICVDSVVFNNALREYPDERLSLEIDAKSIACILYTSGTTDEPKGVMLSHKNLLSNCESTYRSNLLKPTDSVISVLPLHHAYPLTITMLMPLLYGSKIVYPGTLHAEEILKAMQEVSPSIFVAVPQIFYSFHQKIVAALKKIPFPFNLLFKIVVEILYALRCATGINGARYLFRSLHQRFGTSMRIFVSGGARLDENIERDLFKFGFTILEGYGLTETSPVLTFNPFKKPKIGSVGLPIPGVELQINNKDEKGSGEVIVRGPNIMEGYHKRKDLTAEVIKEGWFYTGDLGFIDKDGYLFLTGRSKEVIVLSSGLNVYPEEIEELYAKHVPIKEMCVFEVPAKKGIKETQVLWAMIVPDLDYFKKYGEINLRPVLKERLDNVSRSLPNYKRIMGFSITLEKFPRTLLGKIKRFAVKEMYMQKIAEEKGHVFIPGEWTKEEKVIMELESSKKIINYLKQETNLKKAIAPGDLLELDLGIDSLGRIELASALEKIFNIKIKDEVIGSVFTVKDLILGVESLLKEAVQALPDEGKKFSFGSEYWSRLFQVLPRKENLDKIDLNPGFGAWLVCFLFTCAVYIYFKMFYRLKVEGKNNFPKSGPYILYGNHTSYFDGLLASVSVPHFPRLDLFFVGFRPYFNVSIIRDLIKTGRIIPLDFSAHLLEALRSCYYVLKNGRNVCLFPEGIRSLDGDINDFKRGFGILAKETKAKLVPFIIEGAFAAWPRTSKFPKLHPITVRFGQAQDYARIEKEGFTLGAKDSYDAICIQARKLLIELKEEK